MSQPRRRLFKLGGATAWTKRNKKGGEFTAVKEAGEEEKGREKVQGRASGEIDVRSWSCGYVRMSGVRPQISGPEKGDAARAIGPV
jgi:hypothetical protein